MRLLALLSPPLAAAFMGPLALPKLRRQQLSSPSSSSSSSSSSSPTPSFFRTLVQPLHATTPPRRRQRRRVEGDPRREEGGGIPGDDFDLGDLGYSAKEEDGEGGDDFATSPFWYDDPWYDEERRRRQQQKRQQQQQLEQPPGERRRGGSSRRSSTTDRSNGRVPRSRGDEIAGPARSNRRRSDGSPATRAGQRPRRERGGAAGASSGRPGRGPRFLTFDDEDEDIASDARAGQRRRRSSSSTTTSRSSRGSTGSTSTGTGSSGGRRRRRRYDEDGESYDYFGLGLGDDDDEFGDERGPSKRRRGLDFEEEELGLGDKEPDHIVSDRWEKWGKCEVLPPPPDPLAPLPLGVVHLIGGAVVGITPRLAYDGVSIQSSVATTTTTVSVSISISISITFAFAFVVATTFYARLLFCFPSSCKQNKTKQNKKRHLTHLSFYLLFCCCSATSFRAQLSEGLARRGFLVVATPLAADSLRIGSIWNHGRLAVAAAEDFREAWTTVEERSVSQSVSQSVSRIVLIYLLFKVHLNFHRQSLSQRVGHGPSFPSIE